MLSEPCFVLVHDVGDTLFLFVVLDAIEPWFVFGSDVIEPMIAGSDVIEPMIIDGF